MQTNLVCRKKCHNCCAHHLPTNDFTVYIQDGISPLYVASQEGHTDVVDLLVRAGADIHQATKVLSW